MNIIYFNVIKQNAGWGAEWFVNKVFLKNGDCPINIDYRENKYRLSNKLLKIKKDFDAVLLQRGDGFPLEILKVINRPKFFWATELVSRRRDQDRLFSSGLFKHIFVRGYDCKRRILEKGWLEETQVSILLSGFDQDTHYKIIDAKKDIDISFVGSITPRRRKILDFLKSKNLKVEEFKVRGEGLVKIFNRSKIVLNIHAEDYLDTETRIYEALGSGSFVITEELSEENPFLDGAHLVEVKNKDELIEKILYYLKNNNKREKISLCGYKEANLKHTYEERVKQIISIMKKYTEGEPKEIPLMDLPALKDYNKKEFFLFLKFGLVGFIRRKLSKIKKIILRK